MMPSPPVLVEAYGDYPIGSSCAASRTAFDVDLLLLPYQHSVRKSRKFCSIYQAKINAIKLSQHLFHARAACGDFTAVPQRSWAKKSRRTANCLFPKTSM